jgi:hypothetical protein
MSFASFSDLALYVFETLASQLAIHVFVMLVAPYQSIKALQLNDPVAIRKWLTFWIVYGLLNFFDHFLDSILEFIPFYVTFKLGVVVFLLLGGSSLIFHLVIDPFVKQVIDKKLHAS